MSYEYTPERVEALEDVTAAIVVALEKFLNLDLEDIDNIPWNEDLVDLFDGDQENAFFFFDTIHQMFDIEPTYTETDELIEFDILEDAFLYFTNRLYNKRGIHPFPEKYLDVYGNE